MADFEDEILKNIESESVPKGKASDKSSDKNSNVNFDIADALQLFRSVISNQFVEFSGQLKQEQSDTISKKRKENSTNKVKSERNKIQFEFNNEILDGLEKLDQRARKVLMLRPSISLPTCVRSYKSGTNTSVSQTHLLLDGRPSRSTNLEKSPKTLTTRRKFVVRKAGPSDGKKLRNRATICTAETDSASLRRRPPVLRPS